MKNYVVFLRGINVGGKNKLPMAELRTHLAKAGFSGTKTYIQSGNILIASAEKHKQEIAADIRKLLLDKYGYQVPVMVLEQSELAPIIDRHFLWQRPDLEPKNAYWALLDQVPTAVGIERLATFPLTNEEYQIDGKVVYYFCHQGAGKAKLTNNLIEKKLGVTATSRNLRTLEKMRDLESS